MAALPIGPAMWLSAGDLLKVAQEHHSCEREETWAAREYYLELQSKRIDMIDTVREEMRDQVRLIITSLDNLTFVISLVLLTGFGCACEGTFPDFEVDYPGADNHGTDYTDQEQNLLVAYSIFMGLTTVFPLASLVLLVAMRLEAEFCFRQVTGNRMAEVQKHIWAALRSTNPTDVLDARTSTDDHILRTLTEGLLQKVSWYHKLYPVAQLLLFLGMLSAVTLLATLLGIILMKHFPSMPWVSWCYSGTVAVGGSSALTFAVWMRCRLLNRRVARVAARDAAYPPPSTRLGQPTVAAECRALGRRRSSACSAGSLAEPLLRG